MDMTDREFELLLEERASDLPPNDDLVAEITPWRRAANRILLGTALCSITLNFLLLNYILPAIGMGMILLGFRSLRRENRWFMTGYVIAVVRMVICIFNLILNATIWNSTSPWMTVIGIPLTILHALCVWGGFRAVQIKAGVEQSSKGFWLVVFFVIITVLGVAGFQGTLVILLLLVLYILLLRSLWKYAGFLDDAGYAVQASPVRLSDRAVAIIFVVITTVGILCGYLFFDQYPMDWTEQESISAEAEEIKEELLALGFPEDVLNDLAEEDILNCTGAANIISDSKIYNISRTDGETVSYTITGPDGLPETHTEFIARELRMTHVAVQLDEERDTYVIFHHFLWLEEPDFRGTEALQLWPTSRLDGWSQASGYTGRVLCERDGSTYTAPYYSLGPVTGTSDSIFWENQISTDGIAAFSLPRDAEHSRGYVSYTIQVAVPGYIIDSWCNYYYRTAFPAFPNQGSADAVPIGMASNRDPFTMIVSALQMGYDVSDAIESGIYEYHIID